MPKRLGDIYRSRARNVKPVARKMLGEEAKMALYGIQEAVETELYDRTPLPVTRRMYRSIKLRFAGLSFAVVYDGATAPHARYREKMTGRAKAGHRLNMNPGAYLRKNFGNQLRRVRERGHKEMLGKGSKTRTK